MIRLRAYHLIDPGQQALCSYHRFAESLITQPHQHDFHEFFLVTEGRIVHCINGQEQIVAAGMLVFIRPEDAHAYRKLADERCAVINLAFYSTNMTLIAALLRAEDDIAALERQPMPPCWYLGRAEQHHLHSQLERLSRLQTRAEFLRTFRLTLAGLVGNYLLDSRDHSPHTPMPLWLEELVAAMREPAQFIEGRTALLRLGQRSEEHIGRMFQKHLHQSPSQFINQLRLDYAAQRLLETDDTVLQIAFEAGFNSLSYFYQRFQAQWHESPHEFRQQRRNRLIP